MRGLPHSNDPEKAVKGELWAGVTPSGRSPVMRIPMKGIPRAVKPREEGLVSSDIKPYETQTPNTLDLYSARTLLTLEDQLSRSAGDRG